MEEAAARLEVLVAQSPRAITPLSKQQVGTNLCPHRRFRRTRTSCVGSCACRMRAGWTLKYLKSYGTLIRLYPNAAATQKVGSDLFEIERACLHFAGSNGAG